MVSIEIIKSILCNLEIRFKEIEQDEFHDGLYVRSDYPYYNFHISLTTGVATPIEPIGMYYAIGYSEGREEAEAERLTQAIQAIAIVEKSE